MFCSWFFVCFFILRDQFISREWWANKRSSTWLNITITWLIDNFFSYFNYYYCCCVRCIFLLLLNVGCFGVPMKNYVITIWAINLNWCFVVEKNFPFRIEICWITWSNLRWILLISFRMKKFTFYSAFLLALYLIYAQRCAGFIIFGWNEEKNRIKINPTRYYCLCRSYLFKYSHLNINRYINEHQFSN